MSIVSSHPSYNGQASHQVGVYVNAALGATWEDLASPNFLNLGSVGGAGPQACSANLDFLEFTVWNDSANTVYFVLRPHYETGGVPEVPANTGFPVSPGGVVTKVVSMSDSNSPIFTISVIASGAGSAVRVAADFAARA